MKRALEGLAGVTQASVSLAGDAATVEYEADRVTPKDMIQAVHRVVVLPRVRRWLERSTRSGRRGKL